MDEVPLRLRLARPHDAPAMSRMSRDFIEQGLDWCYSAPRVAALIADRETSAVAACAGDGTLRGFAIMQFGDERAHLVLMCVAPCGRRQGIGRALLGWLTETARVAGMGSIRLELRVDNAEAAAFYSSLGFCETAVVPGYYQGRVAARRMRLGLRAGDAPG